MSVSDRRERRSDAEENRDRILRAAAAAFAEKGLSVSLVEIARRAKVGNATLHRNFTKASLLEELYAEWHSNRMVIAEEALSDPDSWHALTGFLQRLLVDGESNRALGYLFAVREDWIRQLLDLSSALLQRAQNDGHVRLDLTGEDLALSMLGISRLTAITESVIPAQWPRHLALLLDGLRPRVGDALPEAALSRGELDTILRNLGQQALTGGLS